MAVFFVHQIDLDITDVGSSTQIILPHQAIEVDRCSGAGVNLIVGHFLNGGQITTEFAQYPCGLLQGGAFRHVHDHLKLRFVIEGQHFQDNQLEISEADRNSNQQQHTDTQQPAQRPTLTPTQKRTDDPAEQPVGKILFLGLL